MLLLSCLNNDFDFNSNDNALSGQNYYYYEAYNQKCNEKFLYAINSTMNESKFSQNSSSLNESVLNANDNNYYVQKCSSWRFDKTYYIKTVTEEVKLYSNFIINILYNNNDDLFLNSKWNLVCDHAIWRSNIQAVYYSGMLIGSILLGVIAKK